MVEQDHGDVESENMGNLPSLGQDMSSLGEAGAQHLRALIQEKLRDF